MSSRIRSGPWLHASAEREPEQEGTDPHDAVRDACAAAMAAASLTQTQAAREIGVSGTRLSQWLRREYRGDSAETAALVRRWIDTREDLSRRRIHMPALERHAETTAWREIDTALGYAQATGDLALVVGPPGQGKTWCARRYCADASGATYLRATPAVRSLAGLLGRVAASLRVATGASAIATEAAVVAALEGRGALLVIDEAHHLGVPLLDEARCLRDLAGAGVALVADEPILLTLPRCPQVTGRIGLHADLRRRRPGDAVSVSEAVLGRDLAPAEKRAVHQAGGGPRGLHAVRQLLSRAWVLSRADDRGAVTEEDLLAATEQGAES